MKIISTEAELTKKLVSGVKKLSAAVGTTLGPRGQNALIREKGKPPFITKDGVTVANFLELEDEVENAAAEIIKQASRRTNVEAGDGTTTSTVLSSAIFETSARLLSSNTSVSPTQLKRSLEKVSGMILTNLLESVREVGSLDDIRHIATISANNDEVLGDLITKATDAVGIGGSITIENSNTSDTTLDLIEGFRFDSGYVSSSFITDERRRIMTHDEPLFLVTDSKLDSIDQILPSLEIAARESRPFIIVAEEIEGQALAALIMNSVRGNMKVAAINAPGYGETRRQIMSDLAISVGAKFFQRVNGDKLTQISLCDFGSAKSIRSTNVETTIVGGTGDPEKISQTIAALQESMASMTLEEAKSQNERLVRLQSGVAVIRVGGNSEVEVTEKRHRIEDALEATKSAQAEGIVPGGGKSLIACTQYLQQLTFDEPSDSLAAEVLKEALLAPAKIMSNNSGVEFGEVHDAATEDPFGGFDFLTLKKVDLYEAGIIDPYRVTRCCIKNSVSVAGNLLTTNVSIIDSQPI